MILIELHVYDISISLLPKAGVILLLEFYDPNWANFDHFICQIDTYSGLKIDPNSGSNMLTRASGSI